METILFAPEIDNFTENLNMDGIPPTPEMRMNLKKLHQVFSVVKPGENDDFRSIWFEVERGPISAFGNYEEFKECGEVESIEEFDQLWKSYYPDEIKWYNFATAKYKSEMFFYLNSKLICRIDEDEIPKENIHPGYNDYNKITEWLLSRNISDDNQSRLDEMTANKFYAMCEMAYDANNYFKNESGQLTPKEKYLRKADGRDAGLREIDGDSPQDFKKWYHSGQTMGAHPWEICRGGNSTHISLYVSDYSGKWKIRLAGSSVVRVEETVRMALALNRNNISFQLSNAKEIYNMVTGNDYIGIVPDYVTPRYCNSFFPSEDNIIDFMNLGFDPEIGKKIIKKSFWYPIEPVVLS